MIKVYTLNSDGTVLVEITNFISLELQEHRYTLGQLLTINFEKSSQKVSPIIAGSAIYLYDDEEFINAFVVLVSNRGVYTESYSCYDGGFYISRNETIAQAKKENPLEFLKRVFKAYGVEVSTYDEPKKQGLIIEEDYIDYALSEIVEDVFKLILAKGGGNYFLKTIPTSTGWSIEFRRKDLRTPKNFLIYGTDENIFDNISDDATDTTDYTGISNSIKLLNDKTDDVRARAKNEESIRIFGLMESIETLDPDSPKDADAQAQNFLKESEKPEREIQFSIRGNFKIRTFDVVEVDNNFLKGTFEIVSISQRMSNGQITGEVILSELE